MKQVIKDIISDIEYLEELGLGGEEILDSLDPNDYVQATENDIYEALEKCGYELIF